MKNWVGTVTKCVGMGQSWLVGEVFYVRGGFLPREFREKGKPAMDVGLMCAGNYCEHFLSMLSFNTDGNASK